MQWKGTTGSSIVCENTATNPEFSPYILGIVKGKGWVAAIQ
jgi:hypothetical protein